MRLLMPLNLVLGGGATGGGGGGTTPPNLIFGSNLLAWYKKATGIYDAIVGGSLVSADATEIGRWEDQSGNGYHATRANGNVGVGHLQWSTATTDRGSGSVHFTGDSAAFLAIPDAVGSALSAAGQGQLWVRIIDPSYDTAAGSWDFGTDAASNHYRYTDGHWYDGFGTNTRKDCGNPTFDTNNVWHVLSVWSAANDYGAVINNGADFSFTTGTNTVAFRTTNVHFGCSNDTYAMNSWVGEIAITKAKATSTQNAQMQTYLST